jgi:hypothetical protein
MSFSERSVFAGTVNSSISAVVLSINPFSVLENGLCERTGLAKDGVRGI